MSRGKKKDSESELNSDAIEILHDVEYMYNKLDHFIRMNFSEDAYRITGRIKSHKSFIKKVRKKKIERPDYTAKEVDDIIGFRIVGYSRIYIPQIVSRFIRQIREIDIDHGLQFDTTIKEAVLYPSVVNDPAYADQMKEIFGGINQLEKFSIAPRKNSGYSCFHLIINCRSNQMDRIRNVSAEIQFRTAFEDVWAEIEHKTKYKASMQNDEIASENARLYEYLMSQLRDLKFQLDPADNTTSNLLENLDQITSPTNTDSPQGSELAPKTVQEKLESLGILNAKRRYLTAEEARQEAQEALYAGGSLDSYKRKLDASTGFFSALYEDAYPIVTNPNEDELARFSVEMLRLEIAFNSLQLGKSLNRFEGFGSGARELDEANKIYTSVQQSMKDGETRKYALVPYRQAQTLFELKKLEEALALVERALKWGEDDPLLASTGDHWFFVEGPRFLGLIHWNLAERDRQIASIMQEQGYRAKERRDAYIDAYASTVRVLDKPANRFGSSVPPDQITKTEAKKTANNLICYVLDIFELDEVLGSKDGDRALKDKNYKPSDIETYLNTLEADTADGIGQILTSDRAETVCRAYLWLIQTRQKSEKRNTLIKFNENLRAAAFRLAMTLRVKYKIDISANPEEEELLGWLTDVASELTDRRLRGSDENSLKTLSTAVKWLERSSG